MRRSEARRNTPYKAWKLTDEDWRNCERWDQYEMAVEDMLLRTSTLTAPWTISGSSITTARLMLKLEIWGNG